MFEFVQCEQARRCCSHLANGEALSSDVAFKTGLRCIYIKWKPHRCQTIRCLCPYYATKIKSIVRFAFAQWKCTLKINAAKRWYSLLSLFEWRTNYFDESKSRTTVWVIMNKGSFTLNDTDFNIKIDTDSDFKSLLSIQKSVSVNTPHTQFNSLHLKSTSVRVSVNNPYNVCVLKHECCRWTLCERSLRFNDILNLWFVHKFCVIRCKT